MINRVTHQTVQRSTLANLQLNLDRMARLQGKLSGGRVITKPSDDPTGTAQAMQLRADKRMTEQAGRNAADGAAWLTTIDGALTTSVASLRRARDLTVQGGNGAMNAQARDAIALEIEGMRDAILAQANTTYLGRSVFAGTSNAGSAFTATPGTPPTYGWQGTPGASVERRLAPDAVVRVDVDGTAAFGAPGSTVFEVLDRIAADLRAGVNVSQHLTAIDTRMEAMLGELAGVGTRHKQVMDAQRGIEKSLMDLKGSIAEVEDIDFAAVIVELQSQEVAYQAALGATSRVLQPSLMDFLR